MDPFHRVTRLLLWLMVGALLGGAWTASRAEEYSAVIRYSINSGPYAYTDPIAAALDGRGTLPSNQRWTDEVAGFGGSLTLPYPPPPPVVAAYSTYVHVERFDEPTQTWVYFQYVSVGTVRRGWACPSGGTLINPSASAAGAPSGAYCQSAPECESGSVREGGVCVPIVCPEGTRWTGTACGIPECGTGAWGTGNPGDVWDPVAGVCAPPCTRSGAFPSSVKLGSGAGGQTFCSWNSGWSYCSLAVSSVGFRAGDHYEYALTPTGGFCSGTTYPEFGDPVPTEDPNPESEDRLPEESEGELPQEQTKCLARGMTWGAVNGVSMCLPRGTPGGAATQGTDSMTVTDENGTRTRTWTVTTDDDGNVTVEVDDNGEITTTTGTRDAICTEHPTLPVCRTAQGEPGEGEEDSDKSSWGGTCVTGWTCEGDAIQCAIAKEQHERNCELWAETDQAALFGQAITGNDPGLDALDRSQAETVDFSNVIDTTRTIGAGCIDDRNIDVMGHTITIPFSKLCPYLDIMGTIAVAFAMISAAAIIFL